MIWDFLISLSSSLAIPPSVFSLPPPLHLSVLSSCHTRVFSLSLSHTSVSPLLRTSSISPVLTPPCALGISLVVSVEKLLWYTLPPPPQFHIGLCSSLGVSQTVGFESTVLAWLPSTFGTIYKLESPRTSLRFRNMVVGLTELTESYHADSYGLLQGKDTDQYC